MFVHKHPYEPFIPEHATRLIVGTLPPPRFSNKQLKEEDIDFCYGSKNGQLWKILNKIFHLNLEFKNTSYAVKQRKDFLVKNNIGICDIVLQCERIKIDASDLGMQHVILRDLIGYLKKYERIDTILFMGGNSKNGPEYFFRKQLKTQHILYKTISAEVPRVYEFDLPSSNGNRSIRTISLTAPSGAANRAIGSLPLYRKLKSENPLFNTFDFRVLQYSPYFIKEN